MQRKLQGDKPWNFEINLYFCKFLHFNHSKLAETRPLCEFNASLLSIYISVDIFAVFILWYLWPSFVWHTRSWNYIRRHSSRMRTVRCSGCLGGGGGVFAGRVCLGGMSARGVCHGMPARGVSGRVDICLGVCVCQRGVSARHPPVNKMTDRCKNITLLRTVITHNFHINKVT